MNNLLQHFNGVKQYCFKNTYLLILFCGLMITLFSTVSLANKVNSINNDSSRSTVSARLFIDRSITGFSKLPAVEQGILQLFSHGQAGVLYLEGSWRTAPQIVSFLRERHFLTSELEQLNIYGCEFAKGSKGLAAVKYLEQHLGVSVAASTNITGKDGDWILELGNAKNVFALPGYEGNLQCAGVVGGFGANDDFDGDGVCNKIDIDDDNDGVLDIAESRSCFYTERSLQSEQKITSQFASPDDDQADGDIQLLHDGSIVANFDFTGVTAAGNPTGSNLFTIEYPLAILPDSIIVSNIISTTSDANAVVKGSNDGVTWSTALSPATKITSKPIKFVITNSTPFKFYRIETGSTAGALSGANVIGEITTKFIAYSPLAHYNTNCNRDEDNDGILNHFDLDSDKDGCSDSYEAGAISSEIANHTFGSSITDTNGDGLNEANGIDANVDGNTDYVYSSAGNIFDINKCADTDNDGLGDVTDIDDDNDGIIDCVEGGGDGVGSKMRTGRTPAGSHTAQLYDAGNVPFYEVTATSSLDNFVVDSLVAYDNTLFASTNFGTGTGIFDRFISWDVTQLVSGKSSLELVSDVPTGAPNPPNTGTHEQGIFAFDFDESLFDATLVSIETGTVSEGTTNIPVGGTIKSGVRYSKSVGSDLVVVAIKSKIFLLAGSTYNFKEYWLGNVTNNEDPGIRAIITQCTTADTDKDKILNHLDLDSDNDGCADLKESGVNPATDVSTPPATNNNNGGSWGMNTSSLAGSQLNPSAADANNDGLSDSVDPDLNGATNYASTYNPYAIGANIAACIDTDADGITDVIDIDDDNDGIVDAEESPSCFYTSAREMITGIHSKFTSTESFSLLHNGTIETTAATAFNFTTAATAAENPVGSNLFTITYAYPVTLSTLKLTDNISSTATARAHLWGSNDTTQPWRQLTTMATAQNINTSTGCTFTIDSNKNNYKYYQIQTSVTGAIAVADFIGEIEGVITNFLPSANPKPTCAVDTDIDGIANHLDLDSDGDGCADLKEAGVSPATDVSTPPATNNNNGGSWGMNTSLLAGSQLNPSAADANNDGLNDSVDPDLNSATNYISTYNPYAVGANIAACIDTDGDGIFDVKDIDDDNDGIVDAEESPSCFFTAAEMKIPFAVTTAVATTGTIGNVYDNNGTTTFGFTTTSAKTNLTVFEITPHHPIAATALEIEMNTTGQTAFSATASSLTMEGWDGTAWVTLLPSFNPSTAPNAVSGFFQTFTFTQNQTAAYSKFRLQGLAGTVTSNLIEEIKLLLPATYVPSANPKPTCAVDTDIDGIANHLDLDSDGDGCADLKEAGVSPATDVSTPPATNNNNGKSWGIVAGSLAGSQLNPSAADANNDGLNDSVDPDLNGATNYTSTYNNYAINQELNFCTNTDGDGVPDLLDIDDDNDGVLDVVECDYQRLNVVNGAFTGQSPWVNGGSGWSFTGGMAAEASDGVTNSSISQDISAALATEYTGMAEFSFQVSANNFANGAANNGVSSVLEIFIGSLKLGELLNTTDDNFRTLVVPSSELIEANRDSFPLEPNATLPHFEIKFTFPASLLPSSGSVKFNYTTAGEDIRVDDVMLGVRKCILDFDGDGIPNQLDLDSDNDGCYDSQESNVTGSTKTGAVTDSIATGPYGNNGLANSLENNDTDSASVTYAVTYDKAQDSTLNECFDSDGDIKSDLVDIDDDNDGILDAIESPSCFYTAAELTSGVRIYSDLGSPDDNQDDGDIQILHDVATTLTFNYDAGQVILGSSLLVVVYPTPVAIKELSLVNGTTWGTGITARLEGSNDGSTWFNLGNGDVALGNTTNPKVFSNTNTGEFKYYRILGTTGGVNTVTSTTIGEVNTVLPTSFSASSHPKSACVSDADNDGIINNLDLDSDGDGCPDAVEGAGLFTQADLKYSAMPGGNSGVGYTGTSTAPVTTNLGNVVDVDGVPTIATASGQAIGSSQNTAVKDPDCNTVLAPPLLVADINTTFVNTSVSGSVKTNDTVPVGSTYGTPIPAPGFSNPNINLPSMNSDGTYSFVSDLLGVYNFRVPVCAPGQTTDCPTSLLTITVRDINSPTTLYPTASTDIASTIGSTPVTLRTLANDNSVDNTAVLLPGSTKIVTAAKNGMATVNLSTGDITYTPKAGFVGNDTLFYEVCDDYSQAMRCATAMQIITVKPVGSPNSTLAADDYANTPINTPVTKNVLINDTDPEGNTQTVTPQTDVLIPGVGTYSIAADGSYTFTPATDYTGPASFVYEVCDNNAAQACTKATAYFTVSPNVVILPIGINDFAAAWQSNFGHLSWKGSGSEASGSRYEIERSTDGVTYSSIASLNADAAIVNYTYSDKQVADASYNNRTIYYRIKYVEANGTVSYSNARTLRRTGSEPQIGLYPNPSKGKISFSNLQSVRSISLWTMDGKLLRRIEVVNRLNLSYDLGNHADGAYRILLELNNGQRKNISISLIK